MTVPFQAHSETSKDTAYAIEPSAKKQGAMIAEWIESHGWHGATIDEGIVFLSQKFGRDMQASPRFKQLQDAGLIVKTDRKRETRAGHKAVVYVVPKYAGPEGGQVEICISGGRQQGKTAALEAAKDAAIDRGLTVATFSTDKKKRVDFINQQLTKIGKIEAGMVTTQKVDLPDIVSPLIRAQETLSKTGHGYVVPRTDGRKDKCGGRMSCQVCNMERKYLASFTGKF